MSALAERHHDATLAADQSDERLTVQDWHALIIRCMTPAWRKSAVRLTFTELYAITDAALQEALPERFPEFRP